MKRLGEAAAFGLASAIGMALLAVALGAVVVFVFLVLNVLLFHIPLSTR